METEQKLRIHRQFLQDRKMASYAKLDDKTLLVDFSAVSESLDWLEKNASDLFDFSSDETIQRTWTVLENILNYALTLKEGVPPTLDFFRLQERTVFWQRDAELAAIPGCDFYNRKAEIVSDAALDALISLSRENIRLIIQRFLPGFDVNNSLAIQDKMREMRTEANSEQKLHIFMELNKINSLRQMEIEQDDGSYLSYCTLAESVGGVTKNVALISREQVNARLGHFNAANITTLAEYSANKAAFKLNTQAILKLPKKGDVREVQREVIALNIARILTLLTTPLTMVSYQDKPALFIPFSNIRLLTEVASGKVVPARLFRIGQSFKHSTLNPIGEGLQSEGFIDDFGPSFGFMYLCNDTDALGGYNQNKAIVGNQLFIFDQVISDKNEWGLDSRVCMQPTRLLSKLTRTDQGRNRTLIEDSSIDTKFESLLQLIDKQPLLSQYFARIAFIHSKKIAQLKQASWEESDPAIRDDLREQMKVVQLLMNDAKMLKTIVNKRIHQIDVIMPDSGPNRGPQLHKKVLVLERMLNKPILFSEEGRAYRYPWTKRNDNRVFDVCALKSRPDIIKITFDKPISEDVLAMIRRLSRTDSPILHSKKEVLIYRRHLQSLQETRLFPEHKCALIPGKNYLDPDDLAIIQQFYAEGFKEEILKAIHLYCTEMANRYQSPEATLFRIQATEMELRGFIAIAKNKGFGMHILKKFQYDVQQRLQAMVDENQSDRIDEAFTAALRLDQISRFNTVVLEAVRQGKLSDPLFLRFLDTCIDKGHSAKDHFGAKSMSKELAAFAESTTQELKQSQPLQSIAALLGEKVEDLIVLNKEQPLFEEASSSPIALQHRDEKEEEYSTGYRP